MGKIVFSTNGTRDKWRSTRKRTKLNSKWIIDLITLLEENIGVRVDDPG